MNCLLAPLTATTYRYAHSPQGGGAGRAAASGAAREVTSYLRPAAGRTTGSLKAKADGNGVGPLPVCVCVCARAREYVLRTHASHTRGVNVKHLVMLIATQSC